VGADQAAKVVGLEELPGKSNYFIGNDPKKWRTDVPTYSKVKYQGVYPGIDLVYYGNQRQLEYDFVVSPGADPKAITLKIETGDSKLQTRNSKLEIAPNGDLVVQAEGGEVRFHKPVVYQPTADAANPKSKIQDPKLLKGRYALASDNRVSFEVEGYDQSKPLVIDPVLVYSTYLGGSVGDFGYGIAVDSSGSAYVTGFTESPDFPTTNPLQGDSGFGGVFVTKLNAAGNALVYSTYLSGGFAYGIAVDSLGSAYVTGYASPPNFPTINAFQPSFGGGVQNAFVAKLNAAGNALVYSSYLGGSGFDQGYGIAVDSSGNAYVTGLTFKTDSFGHDVSPGFPTVNAFQPAYGGHADAFLTKVDAAGTALVYSTYLGGSETDVAEGIAVDSSGNAYVTGYTNSAGFPTMNPFQAAFARGDDDVFVTKLNASGTALVYSTYLGGGGFDEAHGIAVDSSGNAYVTGGTDSGDFPTLKAFQSAPVGPKSGFVTKLNAAGNGLVYSTYLGGSFNTGGTGIAVDSSGSAYVTGGTHSPDFPTVNAFQSALGSVYGSAFVAALGADGGPLLYSTYLGGSSGDAGTGIALDSSGNAFVTGWTGPGFPTVNAFQPTSAGPVRPMPS